MPQEQMNTQPTNYNGLAGWCQNWFTYLTGVTYPATKRITALEARVTALETANAKMVSLTGQLKVSGDALVEAEKSAGV